MKEHFWVRAVSFIQYSSIISQNRVVGLYIPAVNGTQSQSETAKHDGMTMTVTPSSGAVGSIVTVTLEGVPPKPILIEGGIAVEFHNIPMSVREAGMNIAKKLNKEHAIFALDFIISNSGKVYLLEGNISPGIDWKEEHPENVKLNKKTIDIIVSELARRVRMS